MLRFASIPIVVSILAPFTNAQQQDFPYQARVTVQEIYARSGPGEAFYPTKMLPREAIVNVRRHDPGGWYMIDPPEGSFSWIPTKYVKRTSSQAGSILESNVVVFVGSAFGDETHVWQRKLTAGEGVTILSEHTVETLSGPKQMYRIAPPAREYRWIPGSAVLPVGAAAQAKRDQNPYQIPSQVIQQREQNRIANNTPADTPQPPSSPFSPSIRLAKLKQVREEQRQLQAIDQQFRGMILANPGEWDLEKIEQQYRDLQQNATHKPVAGQIDLRYPAIKRYQQRKAEFDDLNRLTSETERRDAELLAGQYGLPSGSVQQNAETNFVQGQPFPFGPNEMLPNVEFPSNGSILIPNFDSVSTPDGLNVPGTEYPLATTLSSERIANVPASSRFIGAGFVKRITVDDQPGYILTTPSGKVLARLQADGAVDLEQHVGKSVGLQGKRWFDDAVKSDRIEVSGLEPIRIRQ